MVTFQATLSPTSLEKLMQELSSHATKLEESRLDIHEALADYAYERIMFYVPVDTGTKQR